MRDLRLYKSTGNYIRPSSEKMKEGTLADSGAGTALEIIANKVIKYLMTVRGTDPLDKEYGTRLLTYRHMSDSYLPKVRMEVEEDIASCIAFIKAHESVSAEDSLADIMLIDVEYDYVVDPLTLHVYIEIITTNKEYSLLDLPI